MLNGTKHGDSWNSRAMIKQTRHVEKALGFKLLSPTASSIQNAAPTFFELSLMVACLETETTLPPHLLPTLHQRDFIGNCTDSTSITVTTRCQNKSPFSSTTCGAVFQRPVRPGQLWAKGNIPGSVGGACGHWPRLCVHRGRGELALRFIKGLGGPVQSTSSLAPHGTDGHRSAFWVACGRSSEAGNAHTRGSLFLKKSHVDASLPHFSALALMPTN